MRVSREIKPNWIRRLKNYVSSDNVQQTRFSRSWCLAPVWIRNFEGGDCRCVNQELPTLWDSGKGRLSGCLSLSVEDGRKRAGCLSVKVVSTFSVTRNKEGSIVFTWIRRLRLSACLSSRQWGWICRWKQHCSVRSTHIYQVINERLYVSRETWFVSILTRIVIFCERSCYFLPTYFMIHAPNCI